MYEDTLVHPAISTTDLVVCPFHDLLHQSHPLPPDLLFGRIQLVDHGITHQAAEEQHKTTSWMENQGMHQLTIDCIALHSPTPPSHNR